MAMDLGKMQMALAPQSFELGFPLHPKSGAGGAVEFTSFRWRAGGWVNQLADCVIPLDSPSEGRLRNLRPLLTLVAPRRCRVRGPYSGRTVTLTQFACLQSGDWIKPLTLRGTD
jgi:hypothetical protein